MMFSETRVRKTGKKKEGLDGRYTEECMSHHENKQLSLGRTFFWKVGFLSRGNKRTRLRYGPKTAKNCRSFNEIQAS